MLAYSVQKKNVPWDAGSRTAALFGVETKASINKSKRIANGNSLQCLFYTGWIAPVQQTARYVPGPKLGAKRKPGSAGEQTDAELREVGRPA